MLNEWRSALLGTISQWQRAGIHPAHAIGMVGAEFGSEASVAACRATLDDQGVIPDVLVNNAGVGFLGGFLETHAAQWRRIYDVNVLGIVNMVAAFLPAIEGGTGSAAHRKCSLSRRIPARAALQMSAPAGEPFASR